MCDEVLVNGKKYVSSDDCSTGCSDGFIEGETVMVRTLSAGVFYGTLEDSDGQEVTLLDARRVWYWEGAASISELAMKGTSKPKQCKFPCKVDRVVLTEAVEIIDMRESAYKSLNSVPVWSEHD